MYILVLYMPYVLHVYCTSNTVNLPYIYLSQTCNSIIRDKGTASTCEHVMRKLFVWSIYRNLELNCWYCWKMAWHHYVMSVTVMSVTQLNLHICLIINEAFFPCCHIWQLTQKLLYQYGFWSLALLTWREILQTCWRFPLFFCKLYKTSPKIIFIHVLSPNNFLKISPEFWILIRLNQNYLYSN